MKRKSIRVTKKQVIAENVGKPRRKTRRAGGKRRRNKGYLRLAHELFESVTTGAEAIIAAVNPDLRYIFFNQAYHGEIWRLTGKKLRLGDRVEEVYAHMPREQAAAVREWKRTLRGESSAFRTEFGDPGRFRRTYSVRYTPVRNERGQVVGAGEVAWDVTERVRIEQALRESEERLRVVSDNIPGGVIYQNVTKCDGSVRYTYISAGVERLFGLTAESVIADAAGFRQLVVEEDRPRVASAEQEALRDSAPFDCEFRWRTAAGDIKWVHCRSTPSRLADGSILWNGAVTDITERKQAEERLRRSEALYRAIGESIDYGVWVCAPDGRNTYASDSFLKLVGLTQEQCSNYGWGDVLHPEDAERTIAAWKECCRTGGRWDMEHRFRGVDGRYHAILARGVPVKNERGEVVCWAGLNLDISRLKTAQEATRAGEARFRLLADTAGRLLATQDPQGLVNHLCRDVMAHLRCQVFFNYLTEEGPGPTNSGQREGGSAPRLHLNACAGISDEEARRIEWLEYGMAVCGCAAQDGHRVVAENLQHSEDPRVAMVKAYGVQAYCCHPLLSEGRVIGTLSFGTTARPSFTAEEVELMRVVADHVAVAMRRLKMLQALEVARAEALNEKNRLAAVMETLPVGVCILDAQGGLVRTNSAYKELWGGLLPPVRGQSDYAAYDAWWAASGKPVQPDEWASARALHHGETVVNQELQIQRFDGTRAYVLNSAAPIRDADGTIVGCVVGIRDITDHKQAEELNRQLEFQVLQTQKEESLGMLAGGIAHDFNNLLSVIIGNIGLASGELPRDSLGRQLLDKAEEASRHAAGLCQQMLAYVGKTPLSFCPVQLNQLLQDMARLIAASVSKDVQLQFKLADRLPLVHADPNQVQQIVLNLLINASEAIGDRPGQITLTTGSARRAAMELQSPWTQEPVPAGNYVFLEVADTGCGIETSVLARVFDPFFSTKFTGRGLGLSAVLGIVRSHHGTIQVQSTLGRGSAFRVWLPALAGETSAPEPRALPAQDWRGSGTILVVDDEEAIRWTARVMLEQLGFDCVAAADGLEAIEIYRANPDRFWCVLLDATMPKLDGEATFQELLRIRENVRVVLSSGYTKDDIMARFAGRGLSGFLQKPYTLQDLTAILHNLSVAREPDDPV